MGVVGRFCRKGKSSPVKKAEEKETKDGIEPLFTFFSDLTQPAVLLLIGDAEVL